MGERREDCPFSQLGLGSRPDPLLDQRVLKLVDPNGLRKCSRCGAPFIEGSDPPVCRQP